MSYKLKKTCTDKQRADFIVKYNHNLGLQIEETESAFYALEPDEIMQDGVPVKNPNYAEEQLAKAKASKLAEIDAKAYEYENKGLIEYTGKTAEGEIKTVEIETTVVNIGKINGLINMFNAKLITEYPWSSKDDTPIILTVEDAYNLTALFAQFSADIWMVKQPYYKGVVNQAQTAEEVNAIEIDYSKEVTIEEADTNDSEVV